MVWLIGMHDVFDEKYWKAFPTYEGSGLCDKRWIDGRGTIKNHLRTALGGYGQWRNTSIEEGRLLIDLCDVYACIVYIQ